MVSSLKRNEFILNKLRELNKLSCCDGLHQLLYQLKISVKDIFEMKRSLMMIQFIPKLEELNELFTNTEELDKIYSEDDITMESNNTNTNMASLNNIIMEKAKEFCNVNKLDCKSGKVFVNNIDFKVRQKDLWDFFEYFGKVLRCSIIKERKTKRSRGFAFVIFASPLDAKQAITAKKYELRLNGRLMTVEPCSSRRKSAEAKQVWSSPAEEKIKEATEYFNNAENTLDTQSSCIDGFCFIHSLCDEVIIHIFSYLDLVTRVRIEQALNDRILISLLKKGCGNLKSIDLSASPFLISHDSLLTLGSICKELEEINLSQVPVRNKTLKYLGSNLMKLKKIQLIRSLSIGEKGFWWLFKDLKYLKHIQIVDNARLVGKCLYMLPKSVESVDLSLCQRFSDLGLQNLASKCPNITSLDLSFCISITDDGLKVMLESCAGIVDLKLKGANNTEFVDHVCSASVTPNGLQHLKHLENLVSLDISRSCSVNDDIITLLSVYCKQIRFLNMEACHGEITCAGIRKLCLFENLEELNISYIVSVCDECLSELSLHHNLKRLLIRSCCSTTHTGIIQCISYMEKLAYFDLSGCYDVGNSLIPLLQEINREPLTIILGGTEVTEELCQQLPLWCNFNFHNFNVGMLKNDRDPTLIGPFYSDDEEEDEDIDDKEEEQLKTWRDEVELDINEEYPNIDEDGEPIWIVVEPTDVDNECHTLDKNRRQEHELSVDGNTRCNLLNNVAVNNVYNALPIDDHKLKQKYPGNDLQSTIFREPSADNSFPEVMSPEHSAYSSVQTSIPNGHTASNNSQVVADEEDWESEMEPGREWVLPVEYMTEQNRTDDYDEFLQYDDPCRNEIVG